MLQITKEEQIAMYMKLSKKQIIEILINSNDIITELKQIKKWVIPPVMNELTCDSCGCHPNVIFNTSKGRFCESCKPIS